MSRIMKFSQYFKLNKSQYELDFVDIPVNDGDIALFIDPYAISKRNDPWSIECHHAIVNFFQGVIDEIRKGNEDQARAMLSGLREPNQTRFGLSTGKVSRGRGIGGEQTERLYEALAGSTAVKTGFIQDLEECELMIEGIGRDKISDITTNIIRHKLIEYTQDECGLWNIPLHSVPSGSVWSSKNGRWMNEYAELPVCNERSVLLIPKSIARFGIEFDHREYYQHFVLNYLQAEHLSANSSLVRTLKDGSLRPPTKKSLIELNPLDKPYLYEFSKDHPEVLKEYKRSKGDSLEEISVEDLENLPLRQESTDGESPSSHFSDLANKLDAIPTGNASASEYHNHMIGVLTAIFYPFLIEPVKEDEAHEGRKRIDISFQNAARDGFFFTLPNVKRVPSSYIFIECKNYSSDPSNPELDQLSGRFSVNRGQFGFLVCRSLTDKELFIKRCKDTAQDQRGFILVLDDDDIKKLLSLKAAKDNEGIQAFLDKRFRELVM